LLKAANHGKKIVFEDLTQEIVEAWLEESDMNVDAIKAGLDAQIVEKITPTSETKNVLW
jgi:hydroxymethylpyrimidine/phosphomethylpyrimidine kinase